MTNREAYEEAAGMGLEDSFFAFNGIDPNAEYEETAAEKTDNAILKGTMAEADQYLSENKLNSIGSGSILHQRMRKALGFDD